MTFLPAVAGVLGIGQQVLGLGQGISSLFGGGQKKYGPTEQETAMALDMQAKLAGGGGGGAAMAAPIDYYALYGAKAASENNPLTAAMQGLAILQGGLGGALGIQGNTIASSQLTVLKEALDQAQKRTSAQAGVATATAGAGLEQQKLLGQAKLSTELAAPTFLAQAGASALAGENELAGQLAQGNVGLKVLQEQARAGVAQRQADTLADVFKTKAETSGRLALGSQARESGLQLDQARTVGDIKRIQAQTYSNLANIRGQTKAQLAIKQFGANQALAGQRFFA
jgi:hypothetical protein